MTHTSMVVMKSENIWKKIEFYFRSILLTKNYNMPSTTFEIKNFKISSLKDFLKAIIKDETILEFRDSDGNDVFLLASYLGHLDILKYLLKEFYWDINVTNYYGNDAHFLAAAGSQIEICDYIKNINNRKRKRDLTQDNDNPKKKIICNQYNSSHDCTKTAKEILSLMIQISGHTTVKKAKYIKKCIASLTNQYTGKKIGIKKAREFFSEYIGIILQYKFLEIERRLIDA